MKTYDCIILGAGAAGLTSALYLGRYARKCVVVANSIGGTVNLAGEIENWPGDESVSGQDLIKRFYEHAKKFCSDFVTGNVTKIVKEGDLFVLTLGDKVVKGKALILSLGTSHKELGILGEKELLGKGVSYCATCDGMFFKDKNVSIIGGGDSAAKAALFLSDVAKEVSIVFRRPEMTCEAIYLDRMKEKDNIKFVPNAVSLEVLGENKVEGLKIKISDKEEVIVCDGIFIEIGARPCNGLSGGIGINCNQDGYIVTDKKMKTNVEGVFAAGDVTDNFLKQVITASAEGAIAANSVHEFLQTA